MRHKEKYHGPGVTVKYVTEHGRRRQRVEVDFTNDDSGVPVLPTDEQSLLKAIGEGASGRVPPTHASGRPPGHRRR